MHKKKKRYHSLGRVLAVWMSTDFSIVSFFVLLWYRKTHPGLLGPEGLKFPEFMRLAVSGFMSRGLWGPTEDIDILLLSRLSPVWK